MHFELESASIKEADYFILLIGSRVGGWFDETKRISITQQEYRQAYELQRAGKMKLLNFVRSSVWQVREDRRELANYLESLPIDNFLRKTIVNFPCKFASDAAFLSNFISEVSRNRETKEFSQGTAPAPTGNWIHVFSSFKDIIDALRGHLFSSTPIEDLTLKRLLQRELYSFLSKCLIKTKVSIGSPKNYIDKFHAECPILNENKHNQLTAVPIKLWDGIATLSIHLLSLQLHPVVLTQAILMPTFLKFDISTDSYKETNVYETLLLLQNEIRRLNQSNISNNLSVVFEYSRKNHPRHGESINIETMKLVGLLHLLDRWSNIIELSKNLILYLDGAEFIMPSLRPESPIQGMHEEILAERPTTTEIDNYLYER